MELIERDDSKIINIDELSLEQIKELEKETYSVYTKLKNKKEELQQQDKIAKFEALMKERDSINVGDLLLLDGEKTIITGKKVVGKTSIRLDFIKIYHGFNVKVDYRILYIENPFIYKKLGDIKESKKYINKVCAGFKGSLLNYFALNGLDFNNKGETNE